MDCFGLLSGLGDKSRICTYNVINSLNPIRTQTTAPSSDPPHHAGDPPVARHDNLTYDPSSLVVVRPRVEASQGLVVAATEAVTTATVLAAVAVVIQTVIQLNPNLPVVIYRRVVQDVAGETLTCDLGVGRVHISHFSI